MKGREFSTGGRGKYCDHLGRNLTGGEGRTSFHEYEGKKKRIERKETFKSAGKSRSFVRKTLWGAFVKETNESGRDNTSFKKKRASPENIRENDGEGGKKSTGHRKWETDKIRESMKKHVSHL